MNVLLSPLLSSITKDVKIVVVPWLARSGQGCAPAHREAAVALTARTSYIMGLEEMARFIVEMKRAHADARHRGHLFDCVSHRFFSAETTLVPSATLHSRGSRNVRVKGERKKIWEERWIMPD